MSVRMQLWCEAQTLCNVFESNVQHRIVQRSTHQELQAQIVDTLGICERLPLLCAIPFRNQLIPERQTRRRIGCRLVTVEHASSKGSLDMADNFLFEFLGILKALCLELLPSCTLALGD